MLIDNGIIRHKVEISNGVNFGYQQGIGLGISKAEQKANELKSLMELYNSYKSLRCDIRDILDQ